MRTRVSAIGIAAIAFLMATTVFEAPRSASLPLSSTSFSQPINVSNNSGHSTTPAITVDATGTAHVVWLDSSGLPSDHIFYASRPIGAPSFSAPARISMSVGGAEHVAIASDPNLTVHVVWSSYSSAGNGLFYIHRSAGEVSFSPPVQIAGAGGGDFPSLWTDYSGALHLVWVDAGVMYAKKPLTATTFDAPIRVVSGQAGNVNPAPAAVVDHGGSVHVVFSGSPAQSEPSEILYSKKASGASAFSLPDYVANTSGTSNRPALAIALGVVKK